MQLLNHVVPGRGERKYPDLLIIKIKVTRKEKVVLVPFMFH